MGKFKGIWILMKQEIMGWLWHQLDNTQIICTSLQTDNHASTSLPRLFTGRRLFLMPNQQCQSTEGNTQSGSICLHHTQSVQHVSTCAYFKSHSQWFCII